MRARDLMTQPAQSCVQTSSIEKACRRMEISGCGCLPVLDEHGRLAGIVTDRDLALAAGHLDPVVFTVGDVMTRRPFVCGPDDPLETVMSLMAQHKVRRLPVVDGDGELVGLISLADITLWGVTDGGVRLEQVVAAWRCLCSAQRALIDAVAET